MWYNVTKLEKPFDKHLILSTLGHATHNKVKVKHGVHVG